MEDTNFRFQAGDVGREHTCFEVFEKFKIRINLYQIKLTSEKIVGFDRWNVTKFNSLFPPTDIFWPIEGGVVFYEFSWHICKKTRASFLGAN